MTLLLLFVCLFVSFVFTVYYMCWNFVSGDVSAFDFVVLLFSLFLPFVI